MSSHAPEVSTDFQVRRMRARDLNEVASIEHVVFPRPWSLDLFRGELAATDRTYIVAVRTSLGRPGARLTRRKRASVIVGYAGIQTLAHEAHVVTLATHPAWRRLGVGARLVLELLGQAVRQGAEAMTLEVRESNNMAAALYEQFGFVDEGTRPGYYADNQEGARIMWLRDLHNRDNLLPAIEEGRRRGFPIPSTLQF